MRPFLLALFLKNRKELFLLCFLLGMYNWYVKNGYIQRPQPSLNFINQYLNRLS